MPAWRTAGFDIERTAQITVHELRALLDAGEVSLRDVRQPAEWAGGHVLGASFVTGAELPRRLDEVPTGKSPAVVCGSAFRSSVSASLVARNRNVEAATSSARRAPGTPPSTRPWRRVECAAR